MKERLLISAFLLLASCANTNANKPTTIYIGGSAEAYEPLEVLAEAYSQANDTEIVFDTHSQTNGGLRGLEQGDYDIAAVSRELFTATQLDNNQHIAIAEIPLVFITDPIVSVNNLTTEQIQGIYTGDITNWQEVGGIDQPIALIALEDDENEMQELQSLYLGDAQITPNARFVEDEDTLFAISAKTPYALTLAPLEEDAEDFSILSVNGITPSHDNVLNGSYPLDILLGIVTAPNPSPKTQAFLDFVQSDAGAVALETAGYLPTRN